MHFARMLAGRAISEGARWLLLSPTAREVLASQPNKILPEAATVAEERDELR